MGHNQKKTTRRLRLRTENRFEGSDFAFGVVVVTGIARPNRRPIRKATVGHQWMVSKQHSRALHFPMSSLQSRRKIQASKLRNGTIPISHKQFHDLTAKGGVVDKKAADIGCSVKVHVEKASISRLEVEGMHISEDADFPYRMFVVQASYPRPSWWPTRNSTVLKRGWLRSNIGNLIRSGSPATI